jgi:hypothetical protein
LVEGREREHLGEALEDFDTAEPVSVCSPTCSFWRPGLSGAGEG